MASGSQTLACLRSIKIGIMGVCEREDVGMTWARYSGARAWPRDLSGMTSGVLKLAIYLPPSRSLDTTIRPRCLRDTVHLETTSWIEE